MRLFHLRSVDWLDSQLIYHAQARLGIEGINILAPSTPYVCIGYHQNLAQEVDLEYCKAHDIPVFRREVGGGAVFLDGDQIFYQIVLHKDNPLVRGDKADLYKLLLEPVAQTYADLGIPSQYRPVNDVVTLEGRKISGTGAAEIGDSIVLVGNLIADFDYETMTRVLRIPDEKYRDKVFKSMRENLTTIKREIGQVPTWDAMAGPLIRNYESIFGTLEAVELPDEVRREAEVLKPQFLSQDWLFKRRTAGKQEGIKIATGVNVINRAHKAPGGLIRALFELKDEVIFQVSLSGDYFCYPQDTVSRLEAALEGKAVSDLPDLIEAFYQDEDFETPGISPQDWVKVLVG